MTVVVHKAAILVGCTVGSWGCCCYSDFALPTLCSVMPIIRRCSCSCCSLLVAQDDQVSYYRDLLSIETVSQLNAGFCDYHLRHCPPSQQMLDVCTEVGQPSACLVWLGRGSST